MRYAVGQQTAFGSDAGEPVSNLWNPSSDIALRVRFAAIGHQAALAGSVLTLVRFSTTGTTGNIITPDVDNDYGRAAGPDSGAVLRVSNFSVSPTVINAAPLVRWVTANGANCRLMIRFEKKTPLIVPPGTGIGWVSSLAGTSFNSEWSWDE